MRLVVVGVEKRVEIPSSDICGRRRRPKVEVLQKIEAMPEYAGATLQ